MKAILCKEWGLPSTLVKEDVELPTPKAREVHIAIKACGVNYPDTLIIQGLYQLKPELPFSPGSDITGVVKAVGADVKRYKVGDEVVGFTAFGGFAEEIILHEKQLFHKPPQMTFDIAASFLMAYGTSYHALKDRANIQKGETLVVLGASGGVGLAAVELGKILGARVIAAASTDEKLALCKAKGADELINYTNENLKNRIKELTGGKGADVVYDPVGGDYSEKALRALGWNGRFLVVGFPAGIPKIPLNLPLLKSCQIVGVFYGRFVGSFPKENAQNTKDLLGFYISKQVQPHIDKRYALEEVSLALEDMMNRKVKGKIVIVP